MQQPIIGWKLDSNNVPTDPLAVQTTMRFLVDQPEWVQNNPEETRKWCATFVKTNFKRAEFFGSKSTVQKMAEQCHQTLLTIQPAIFPTVKISIRSANSNVSFDIPEYRLKALSDNFQIIPNDRFLDLGINYGLDVNKISTYLTTGNIEFTCHDVQLILFFAQQHGFAKLQQECIEYMSCTLSILKIENVIKLAIHSNNPDVIWLCLEFLQYSDFDISRLGTYPIKPSVIEKATRIVELAKQCKKAGIQIFQPIHGDKRKISLSSSFDLQESLPILRQIHQEIGIESVTLDSSLDADAIATVIPNPLIVIAANNTSLRRIPNAWVPSVQEINVKGTQVTRLDLPNARVIICSNCQQLTSVNAPMAKLLVRSNTPVLTLTTLSPEVEVSA